MTASAACAEPAAPASQTADECLAKPNAPAPQGSHWYYRIDRQSGRHCWYLREQDAKSDRGADEADRAARRSSPAPAVRPFAEAPSDTRAASDEGRSMPPPMGVSPNPAVGWPSSAAPSAPVPARTDTGPVEQVPRTVAVDSNAKTDAADANAGVNAEPAPATAPRPPTLERPHAAPVETEHLPALLGTALALFAIVFGSLAFRWTAQIVRQRRSRLRRDVQPSRWDAYPESPFEPDITEPAPARAPVQARERNRNARTKPNDGERIAQAQRMELADANIRELLRRLSTELATESPRTAADTESASGASHAVAPHVAAPTLVPGDLDAALASWQVKRR